MREQATQRKSRAGGVKTVPEGGAIARGGGSLIPATRIVESDPRSDALIAAFRMFSKASVSLEQGYSTLRRRADNLSRRLEETEARLRESLAENRRLQDLAARRSRLEAMGRMAAEIAHEIRNPLGSLELTASLLRDDLEDDPERKDLALSILEGIRALTRVTGNLLTFTRSVVPRMERLDARACLVRARDLARPACQARGIEPGLDAPEGLIFRGDGEILQQVLLNLLQNGIEATAEGGSVVLSASRAPRGGVELRVHDSGTGMDGETLARVFDPFFTTKERGTGLGLSVSYRLSEAMGARMELSSTPGAGTTAVVAFPEDLETHG